MFLTKDDLKLAYGVDLEIGEVYVNRRVPADNLYWKNRTIYIPGSPGYIFMPIFADVLYRCGADKDIILTDHFIGIAEQILHSAALLEHKQITWQEHVHHVQNMILPVIKNQSLFQELSNYLNQDSPHKLIGSSLGTEFSSLNRADSYLYCLCCIEPTTLNLEKALQGWYALMTYFLILDDLADIKEDLKKAEENVLIDAGLNETGVKKVNTMIEESMMVMQSINPVMANRIDHKRTVIDIDEIIRSITA
ncbi:MAG: hypothetical protein ACK5AO_07415 [bacterium]|jgi:hypothetical protein